MQHGSGNQMWEPRDEQQVMDEVDFPCDAAIDIDEKSNLGKGEEGNAQRQDDIQRRNVATEELVGGTDKKVGVFEIAEQNQVDRNRGGQRILCLLACLLASAARHNPIQ